MADSVEVKLGADTSEATRGADDAATRIANSLDAIQAALQKFGTVNKQTMAEAVKNNADLSRSFLELKASATGGFNAITGVIERFRGVIGTLATAIAGGALFGGAVAALLRVDSEVEKLENVLGMASDKATEFAMALKIAGSSADQFTALSLKLARQLKANEEAFTANGVATRNLATGALLPLDTVMQNAFTRMGQLKAGVDQAEFALTFFGRSVQEVYELMVILPAAQERAKQLMQEMGVEFGPDRQAAVQRYKIEVGAFRETLNLIGEDIGIKVIPKLQALASELSHLGPIAADAGVKIAAGILGTTDLLVTGLEQWAIKIKSWWDQILIVYDYGMRAIRARISSGKDAAVAVWEEMERKRVAISLKANAEILGLQVEYQKRIAAMGAPAGPPGPGPMPHGTATFVPTGVGGGADARMAEFKAELDQMNLENGAFHQLSKQNEMEFWEEKLSLVRGKGAEEVKLRQEITREILRARNAAASEEYAADVASFQRRIAAAKDNEAEQMMLVRAFVEFEKAINGEGTRQYEIATAEKEKIEREWVRKKQEIDRENQKNSEEMLKLQNKYTEEYLNQEVAMGRLSVLQKLAIETDLENSLYAEELRGLDLYIATLTEGTLEYAKALNQRKKLTAEHEIELTKIANAAELERQKYALEAEDAIRSSMADTISKLVSNTQNWKKTLLDAFKALDEALVRIAANKVVNDLFGAGTKGGGILGGIFGKIFGASPIGTPPINPNDTAEIGAQTANTAAITTNTAIQTTAEVSITANTTALVALTTAVAANTAALAVSSASSSLGGFSSAFSGIAELPFLDSGSSFVPHDMVAVVHRGEAVIPAAMNKPGGFGQVNMRNMFMFNGPVDTRTQYQIAAQTQRAAERAMKRSR